jgi:hypothetical protein
MIQRLSGGSEVGSNGDNNSDADTHGDTDNCPDGEENASDEHGEEARPKHSECGGQPATLCGRSLVGAPGDKADHDSASNQADREADQQREKDATPAASVSQRSLRFI